MNKIKNQRLTSKSLLMYFSSMTPLVLLLAWVFRIVYVADSNTHICLYIQTISRFLLKRLLNPDSHRYVVTDGMSTAGAVSQSFGNKHSRAPVVFQSFLSNCIWRARFEQRSIRSFSSPSSVVLFKLSIDQQTLYKNSTMSKCLF